MRAWDGVNCYMGFHINSRKDIGSVSNLFKKIYRHIYPILDTRISVILPFVCHAQGNPLDSARGWTGELWSKTNLLKSKGIAFSLYRPHRVDSVIELQSPCVFLSVCSIGCSFFLKPLIGPEVTWSVPGPSLVLPPSPTVPLAPLCGWWHLWDISCQPKAYCRLMLAAVSCQLLADCHCSWH